MPNDAEARPPIPPTGAARGPVIECDLISGRARWTARLAAGTTPFEIAAIWRNEIGPAEVTAPLRQP